MIILFSEHESFYRDLGLLNRPGLVYVFDGLRFYKKKISFFYRFDAFVCAFYTMPHNVMLTTKFKRLNKKTILCSDGIFEFSNAIDNEMVKKYGVMLFHPIIQDYFLCVGEEERKYFNETVFALRYMPKRMLSKKDLIELPKSKRTLITTANTAYFTVQEFNRLEKLILDVVFLLIENSIEFSFRFFDERLLNSISDVLDVDIINDIQHDFEVTIESYSSVITTPSSIAITSMYHQRAVSLLVYRDKPMFLQAGWLTPSSNVLRDTLYDFVNLNSERIAIQNNIVKSYFTENGITDHIENIVGLDLAGKKKVEESYINKSLLNMLESKFNINIEWFARKLYLRLRNNSVIRRIRLKIR
jgi:hypothetical protein